MSLLNHGRSEENGSNEEYLLTFCILHPNEFPDEIKESEKSRYRCYVSEDIAEKALGRYQRIFPHLDLTIKPVKIIKGE